MRRPLGAEDPYERFLNNNRMLARTADAIIEGIAEFASFTTEEHFKATVDELKEKGSPEPKPTNLREVIERKFVPQQMDKLARRRFSLSCRAAEIATGHSPWHHQVVCGLLLSRGSIVQMPNGSGKTLSIALAAAYTALCGLKTHAVTSNDYLAERDCRWMGRIYRLLGISVGVLFTSQSLHFQHGVLASDGVTLKVAPVDSTERWAGAESPTVGMGQHASICDADLKTTVDPETSVPTIEASPVSRNVERAEANQQEVEVERNEANASGVERDGSPDAKTVSTVELQHATELAYVADLSLTTQQVLKCDVVYGRMEAFAFAYLRDNLAYSTEAQELTQRDAIIVDECDSVLLDDLRLPLILTRDRYSSPISPETIARLHGIAQLLRPGIDFVIDGKAVALTYFGVDALRSITGTELFTVDMGPFALGVLKALEAIYTFERDRDYITHNGRVVLVEAASGRLLFGRRYRDGLHEAIEYKEGLPLGAGTKTETIASVTIKHFVKTYSIVSGTSGAIGLAQEYRQFYRLESIEIEPYPTHRRDHPDLVYRTKSEIVEYGLIPIVIEASQKGQPVLVNVPSQKEILPVAEKLREKGIPVQALDASTVRTMGEEAEKIKRAGTEGLVTICSKLAARGTDIVLTPEARAAGGLLVIGLRREFDRRYDDQLRGRAGRHRDPGESLFILSLEDDLLSIFGGAKMQKLMLRLGMETGVPIDSPLITRRIRAAQRAILRRNHAGREQVVELDDIMDRHRTLFYKVRQKILAKDDLTPEINSMLQNWLYVWRQGQTKQVPSNDSGAALNDSLEPFAAYWGRAEIDRIMNVRSSSARFRVLKDAAEHELAAAMADSQTPGTSWFKMLLLSHLDERWTRYLSWESATRDELWLYPANDSAGMARYAQGMEESFDSFFLEVGSETIAAILRQRQAESWPRLAD